MSIDREALSRLIDEAHSMSHEESETQDEHMDVRQYDDGMRVVHHEEADGGQTLYSTAWQWPSWESERSAERIIADREELSA